MLNIHKDVASDGAVILKLEGDATIEYADQLHQTLLTELKANEKTLIDCSATNSIGLYAIQLFCSAHRSSVTWKKSFSFTNTPSAPVVDAIKRTGFLREHGCSLCPEHISCMWSGHISSSDN